VIVISVLTRRLREGKTYGDFREAWLPDQGFGVPTRVVTGRALDDDREIVNIGFVELEDGDLESQLKRIAPQEQRRHDRIDEIIEPKLTRHFYVQIADDDFTDAPPREGCSAFAPHGASPPTSCRPAWAIGTIHPAHRHLGRTP
jgi:hypothetical protein